jgi:hypothetical protein
MAYVPSVRPVTPKPDGVKALDVKHPKGLNNSSQKELRSKTNHFLLTCIFWRVHSMLNEARGPVTQWSFFFF